ncbi:esterase/lipase family protein [Cognaticolwellia beringensis]|uniref:Alpha/beta hydrolase n=1 Tax=Cognaticolwellia beringensis TaxID=1967665 RepID=A0A222GC31_9GAMM|nr:alpha/beta hydrolase [Cognaticolwellia beringensis]ASP49439.1 alpha/beta hydrolase [Cognaticolwellia beringensis]
MMTKLIYLLALLSVTALLTSCSSSRFFDYHTANVAINNAVIDASLPDLAELTAKDLHGYCLSTTKNTDVGLISLLHCANELLGRENLSQPLRNYAIASYNQALYSLVKLDKEDGLIKNSVTLHYANPSHFTFSEEMFAIDSRLQPKIFGQLGIPVVSSRENKQIGLDKFAPLEGVMKGATIILVGIKVRADIFELVLELQFHHEGSDIKIGDNTYSLKHSPGSAFLALIEQANIDQFSWLGFISPSQAEKRRGVFAIGGVSAHKIPIIMIHGLNSDPLIWRHLTMAVLNEPKLMSRYQIWHVYYPSGPPPFYSASRTREHLTRLLKELDSPSLADNAVFIGHSMGGVLAKLLATKTNYSLWDTAFNKRPEEFLTDENNSVKDIFIFEPLFKDNTVFFLDTPFKGSEVANSTIGYIGALLVTLPREFTQLFQALIKRVGPEVITEKMQPFLLDYGPNSVQVLRPGHPLMTTLYDLPIAGDAYAIVGSNGELVCADAILCSAISDGVVSYDSANYRYAKEVIIAPSSHNSFQSQDAINFIVGKLKSQ